MLAIPFRRGTPVVFAALGVTLSTLSVAPRVFAQSAEGTVHTDANGRHLAPHDTFYTLAYVSARTAKGVEGFPPGTEVHLVSVDREAHTLTVSDGKANVEVTPDKLTNDLDIAEVVKAKDDAHQARIAAYQQAQTEAYEKYQKEVADSTAKDLERRQQEIRDANTRAQEQANAEQNAQAVNTDSIASNSGYYNEGGYGYGSPYGYFIDPGVVTGAERRAQNSTASTSGAGNSGGRGTVSLQNNSSSAAQLRPGGAVQNGGGAPGAKK